MGTDTKDLKFNDPIQGVKGCATGDGYPPDFTCTLPARTDAAARLKKKGRVKPGPTCSYAFGAAAGGTVVTEAFS
jgi:hypothetical protein